MIVGLDIDDVVADFLSPFLRFVEKRIGNGPIALDSITDRTFKQHPALTEEIVSECMVAVSHDPCFWRDLAPMITPKEWEALEELSRGAKLVFVTHRYERESYDIHQVTSEWLKKHGVTNPVIHFTQESKAGLVEKLGVRLFMDDRYENCKEVAERTQALVLMPHRSYNQSFSHPRIQRIQNFNELFSYI